MSEIERIRDEVIAPVVDLLGGGQAARELLFWTGWVESKYATREQLGGGPALGYWQMEPDTHYDIWNNYLAFRPGMAQVLVKLLPAEALDGVHALEFDDRYACALARVHYKRVREALPEAGNLVGMAAYWKTYYNTSLGAGTVPHFQDHCAQCPVSPC